MFEEGIRNISTDCPPIKIGLPKGNVYQKSIDLVEKIIGERVPKGKLEICYKEYKFYFLKHRDIPVLIQKGILDFGITSDEWIIESEADVVKVKELDWCDTDISLIVPSNNKPTIKTCVTEYINIANQYFKKKDMEIAYVSGSCEALVPSIFDCCIGCVESGSTLKQNNLVVEETILRSKIVLVGNKKFLNKDINILLEMT